MKTITAWVRQNHWWIAGGLLTLMFALGTTSMAHDSAIVDEVAHIPAGYSYDHLHDYRLNPEHPPLLKALAGLPLQFMHLEFSTTNQAWSTDVNGQWESGWHFLYHDGNNANAIIFWARLPILLLAIVFGGFLYHFVRQRFGTAAGLLTVFFYSLCPNILAHARFVTTDVGAAVFMFVSFVFFVRFLEKPGRRNAALAALFLALAQLAKFSAVLIVPLFVLMAAVAIIFWNTYANRRQRLWIYGGGLIAIGIAALLLVWLAYVPFTWSMPAAVQDRLIDGSLNGSWQRAIGLKLIHYNHLAFVRPLAQYILGVLMVFTRVRGGNTTYFMGQVSNQSFFWYFPFTYAVKTPLAFLVLLLASILGGVSRYMRKTPLSVWNNAREFSRTHFVQLSALLFIFLYSYFSITGNLNLGIRHLLPMFPFIMMLVAYEVVSLSRGVKNRWWALLPVGALMVWYAVANFSIYPSYLAYFNELIGGPTNADKYVSDSSVDWGQDLLRLHDYVASHPEIQHIGVDYFGGGEPKYYFCDRRYTASGSLIKDSTGYDCSHSPYVEWHAQNGLYHGNYMAVSETFLTNDIYWSKQRGDDGYNELRKMTPIAKIGYSIYVYKIP